MLSLFRTNQLLAGILFLPYLLLCRVSGIFSPRTPEPESAGIATSWLYGLIGYDTLWAEGLAVLLLFVQAIWLSAFLMDTRMTRSITLFPGVLLALFCSLFPAFLHLSPLLVANFFLLGSVTQLSGTYKKHDAAVRIFNSGLWLGVATLFVPAYLAFFVFAMAGLTTLRAFSLRERLMVVLGMITPYILTGTWLFWNDELAQLWQHTMAGLGFFSFSSQPPGDWAIKVGLFGAMTLLALTNYGAYLSKQSIQTQKIIQLQYWLLFSAGLFVLVQPKADMAHLLSLCLPLALLLSLNLVRLRPGMAELVHLTLLLIAAWFQLSGWLLPA